jgi:hypothetical protein
MLHLARLNPPAWLAVFSLEGGACCCVSSAVPWDGRPRLPHRPPPPAPGWLQVGVATAFKAPIGGLLFAFEEVASFWQHSLGWQVGCRGGGVKLGRGGSG